MTMMSNLAAKELEFLDEEYLGPPPRFLTENRHTDSGVEESHFFGEDDLSSTLGKLKTLLGKAWS